MKKVYNTSFLVFTLFLGCTLAEVKVDVVSERTTLENQVLGTYNALDREMLLVASVRGVDSSGRIQRPPQKSQDHRDVLLAMQTIAFHEDDLQIFKRVGWVGETRDGLLFQFPMEKTDIPEEFKEFAERYGEDEFGDVVTQINRAREVVMRRVIAMNEIFHEKDLPRIRRIFGRLNRESALPGEKIQDDGGSWTVKK